MVPRVAKILPAKALPHQLRQKSAVIDVGMGQQDGIDIGGPEWECAIVERLQRLGSLKKPAVDEHAANAASRTGSKSRSRCEPRRRTAG